MAYPANVSNFPFSSCALWMDTWVLKPVRFALAWRGNGETVDNSKFLFHQESIAAELCTCFETCWGDRAFAFDGVEDDRADNLVRSDICVVCPLFLASWSCSAFQYQSWWYCAVRKSHLCQHNPVACNIRETSAAKLAIGRNPIEKCSVFARLFFKHGPPTTAC